MDFLQNTRYSLAVAADFAAKYDRLTIATPTSPTLNLRTNNRIAGW